MVAAKVVEAMATAAIGRARRANRLAVGEGTVLRGNSREDSKSVLKFVAG